MFDKPSYLVQVGHNGHLMTKRAMEEDYADGAILSPSDYEPHKNEDLAETIKENSGKVLFDPQFYIPRVDDRPKLAEYEYHDIFGGEDFQTSMLEDEEERRNLCSKLVEVQDRLEVDAYIAPGRFLDVFTDANIMRWKDLTETFIEVVEEVGRDIPVFGTLALADNSLIDKDEREKLLNRVTAMDVDGFYVSTKFDVGDRYPLSNASNIYSYLHFLNGLKQNRYEIIVGHTHHIAHLIMGIGINAFASGHYKNLRAFDDRRWKNDDDHAYGGPVVNYYSDELLNDLRVNQDLNLLYQGDYDFSKITSGSPIAEPLFEGQLPEDANWTARDSWDHYTWACFHISRQYRGLSKQERIEKVEKKIKNAENLYEEIKDMYGPLSEPDEDIYRDWNTAFSMIKRDIE